MGRSPVLPNAFWFHVRNLALGRVVSKVFVLAALPAYCGQARSGRVSTGNIGSLAAADWVADRQNLPVFVKKRGFNAKTTLFRPPAMSDFYFTTWSVGFTTW